MKILTMGQYRILCDFYAHCYNVYHRRSVADFDYWAGRLDKEGIAWSIQNITAGIAGKYDSQNRYLRTHLEKYNILVRGWNC